MRAAAQAANWWGGDGVVWAAALLWLGGRAIRRNVVARVGLRGAEALAIASAISGIAKGLAGRARPFVIPGEPWHFEFNHGWTDARYFSLPSGHTTATVAFAAGIALALSGAPTRLRLAVAIPLLLSAGVVAWARIVTDQHWLSDVTVGMVLGTLTSLYLSVLHRRSPSPRYERVMLGARA